MLGQKGNPALLVILMGVLCFGAMVCCALIGLITITTTGGAMAFGADTGTALTVGVAVGAVCCLSSSAIAVLRPGDPKGPLGKI